MKKLILLLLFALTLPVYSQFFTYPDPNKGNIAGGLGVSFIDNKAYYTFHFRPEIAFANFGVGLDLNLEFNSDGKIRHENFNEFSDYLSIIRYLRYGHKRDPFYARLGALDYATLGHGTIMYLYNNSPSFDARRIGLELDFDMDKYGIETVYGNFAQSGVVGVRGYVRPLKFTDLSAVPFLNNLEVGASYAADYSRFAGVQEGSYNAQTDQFNITKDHGALHIMGFDVGLPIRLSSIAVLTPYFDYNKILDYGSGTAAGIMAELNGMGLVSLRAKLERRFNGDNYLPSYFNSMYELERFMTNTDTANGSFYSKINTLTAGNDPGNGFYGELFVRVLNMFDILGSYQRLDKDPQSGILHLSSDISPIDQSYVARVGYDKLYIKDEADLFKLDDRSLLYAEAGYKPMPYVLVSLMYSWTFTPVRDADERIIDYKPQKRIEPRVSFVYPFNF